MWTVAVVQPPFKSYDFFCFYPFMSLPPSVPTALHSPDLPFPKPRFNTYFPLISRCLLLGGGKDCNKFFGNFFLFILSIRSYRLTVLLYRFLIPGEITTTASHNVSPRTLFAYLLKTLLKITFICIYFTPKFFCQCPHFTPYKITPHL